MSSEFVDAAVLVVASLLLTFGVTLLITVGWELYWRGRR